MYFNQSNEICNQICYYTVFEKIYKKEINYGNIIYLKNIPSIDI